MENTLNPQALALTKAIKQHESGGKYDIKGASQEYGAYQWTPDTWKSHAKAVLGDENADITNPTLQNKVAYSVIEKDLKSGLSPAEVSAKWNSGQPKGWENKRGVNKFGVKYDVPAYVNSVGQLYTQEYQKAQQPQIQQAPTQQPSEFNPLFPSNPDDSLLETGAKTLGNVIPSAFNFAKNTLSAINPINTIKNIGQIGSEFQALSQEQGGVGQALSQTAQALPQSLYEGLVPTAGREIIKAGYQGVTGQDTTQSLQKAQQAITEDPFGQIAPFVLGARQLAEKAGYVKQFDDFVKRGVDATLKPITAPAKFVGEKAGQVARGGVAQATGLNPETVKALIDNPELYTKTARQNLNRSAIASKVGTALDDLESQVSDTGAGYNAIRENTGVTYVAPTFLSEALKPFNIKVQNGRIVTSAESTPLSTADITQLQKFVDDFGNERFLTNNAFLNARTALSDMSKYDAQKTGRLQSVARTLREAYDAIGKEKIEGLKNLDEQFAPLKQQFETLKKDYLTKENGEYVFKQGAVTKLANLDKVGRERILGRLEELVPDIGKEIKMLKVVEDIERASGIKVGTYGKGALLGAGLLSGGVVGAIISAILTSPEIAVPLIRGYGLTKNQTAQVLMNLRLMLGETKQSGMDLLQKEIPVEDMVNALTGKGIPNRQGGFIKNPLANEKLIRGVSDTGTTKASGVNLYGKGLYLTDDAGVAKHYGNKIENHIVSGNILDATKPLTKKDFTTIIQGIEKRLNTDLSEYKNFYLNDFPNDLKIRHIIDELESHTGDKPIKAWAKNNGMDTPDNSMSDTASLVNDVLKDQKVVGLKYSTDDIEDLYDKGMGGKNAYVIFDSKALQKTNPLIQEAKKYKSAESFYKQIATAEDRGVTRKTIGFENLATPTDKLKLKVNPNNPRIDESTVKIYKEEIKKGRRMPLIIDDNFNIIDGHHKLMAYEELGFMDIPTVKKSQLEDIWKQANK